MNITSKLLQDTIDTWKINCDSIMDSQKEYNRIAMDIAIKILEDWKKSLDSQK